jgi:hypothetical protein
MFHKLQGGARQGAFEKGEMRYYEYVREKTELVWDVYDFKKIKAIKKKKQKGSVITTEKTIHST